MKMDNIRLITNIRVASSTREYVAYFEVHYTDGTARETVIAPLCDYADLVHARSVLLVEGRQDNAM